MGEVATAVGRCIDMKAPKRAARTGCACFFGCMPNATKSFDGFRKKRSQKYNNNKERKRREERKKRKNNQSRSQSQTEEETERKIKARHGSHHL